MKEVFEIKMFYYSRVMKFKRFKSSTIKRKSKKHYLGKWNSGWFRYLRKLEIEWNLLNEIDW